MIIKPETIIRWHRKYISQHLLGNRIIEVGRPRIPKEIIELIKRIAVENLMWGISPIHDEILHEILRN